MMCPKCNRECIHGCFMVNCPISGGTAPVVPVKLKVPQAVIQSYIKNYGVCYIFVDKEGNEILIEPNQLKVLK